MAKVVHLRNIKRALQIDPKQYPDSVKYVIGGRVNHVRSYKAFNFIDLTDGSSQGHIQAVIEKDVLKKPELGAYLICQGELKPSPGTRQSVEFKVDQLNYVGSCDPLEYPLASAHKNPIADGWFRQNLHLRPRASHFASLLRVRSELEMSLNIIFRQMDFLKVHTPILTANDSEASSDLFSVQRSKCLTKKQPEGETSVDVDGKSRHLETDYFNQDVFMIPSAQLHLESLAASLSRVYCLAPAFRAESSLSQRHLCEFTMLEAEESNLTRLESLMDRVETVIKFSLTYLAEVSEFKEDFAQLINHYHHEKAFRTLTDAPYVRMTYDEAIEILQRSSTDCQDGSDFDRKHERTLLEYCDNVPIFLVNYPKSLKPFYMKACDNAPDKVQNFDLIAPFGGEICGGSLREDNLQILQHNLNDASQDGGRFGWYLDLRKFGSFPHGGFGIGLERLVQSFLGIRNIRDTIAFPRWPGNCSM